MAQTTSVTTTVDEVNGNTGSIALLTGTPGGAGISLREAILAANNEPNGSVVTITMPAGTFTTTIAGAAENLGVSGDIDVNVSAIAGMKTVTINGAGAGATIITGSTGERVFDVHPVSNPGSITFNLSGVTISNTTIASASGAALLLGRAGDISNISNCVFSGNSAPNSGAISQSSSLTVHDLTVTNCTFTNNTATSGGPGALNYNGIGNVTITGCTFSGNTAATQGGAVNITGGGTGPVKADILRNTFLNNRANGTQFGGAAVAIANAQIVNINFNRLVGNTSPNLVTVATPPNNGDGRVITATGGVISSLNVDNNWWGINTGPVTTATFRSVFGATTTRWLQFKNTASPTSICTSSTSTITAGFLSNNLSEAITAGNLASFVGQPITFNTPVNGTLSSAQTTIQASGTATVIFTATAAGSGTANAVFVPLVENVTVSSSPGITIIAGASITSSPSPSTACSGLAVSFTGSASNQTSLAWQESADIGFTTPTTLTNTGIYSNTSTATLNISDNSGVSGRYYRLVAINSNGCPNANSTGALLTATAPTLPGTTSATNTIGTNNNLSYAASCGIVSKVVPSGGTPVSGIVTSNVWVEAAVPTFGGTPFVQRHYQITPASGSTATVTLYFSQAEFNNFNAVSSVDLPTSSSDAAGKANMRISKFNGSSTGGGLPGSYSAGGSVINPVDANIIFNATLNRWEVSFDVSGFSGFFVQTSTTLLPVNLISFSAQKILNDVQLRWQTSGETGNSHFELERSLDGRTFATIGQRTANNGTGIKNYDLLDAGAAFLGTSKIFYRLKIVSIQGSVDYSNTIVVLNKVEVGITGVLPNPFTDKLHVNLNMAKTGRLTVKLTDMSGRILRKENTQVPKGFSTYTMAALEKIAAGIYFISIDFEGETYTYKVMK